jgi:inosine-uridine nucleoside N-ribohydrolase
MVLDANSLQFSVPMSKAIAASWIRMKSRPFEENSILTRGESVVDRLGVTNRQANCFVMVDADQNKFFSLLQKEPKI